MLSAQRWRGGLFLRGCGFYWLCDNIHLVWWRTTLFGLGRPWSTGAASASGNRGQQRSGVTTLTYIHLHWCRGLRVKFCSRRSISHFSHSSIYINTNLTSSDRLISNTFFKKLQIFPFTGGSWTPLQGEHTCVGALSMVLISSAVTWPHRWTPKHSSCFIIFAVVIKLTNFST